MDGTTLDLLAPFVHSHPLTHPTTPRPKNGTTHTLSLTQNTNNNVQYIFKHLAPTHPYTPTGPAPERGGGQRLPVHARQRGGAALPGAGRRALSLSVLCGWYHLASRALSRVLFLVCVVLHCIIRYTTCIQTRIHTKPNSAQKQMLAPPLIFTRFVAPSPSPSTTSGTTPATGAAGGNSSR